MTNKSIIFRTLCASTKKSMCLPLPVEQVARSGQHMAARMRLSTQADTDVAEICRNLEGHYRYYHNRYNDIDSYL